MGNRERVIKIWLAALVALLGINMIPSIAQAAEPDAAVPFALHLSCIERCTKDNKGTFNEQTGVCTPADATKHPYRSFDKCEVSAFPPSCPDKDKDGYPDFACGGKKADNCVKDANGLAQAGIRFIGDQTDSDGDGIGDACDGATKAWVKAELEARAGAAMEILAQLGDRKQDQLEAMAALREAIEGGGIVNIEDLNRALRPLYVAVDCFNQGKVAHFSTIEKETRVTCVQDPWRVAKDATDERQDAATHALERRTATVAVVGVAEGFGTLYGIVGGELNLVARPSGETEGRIGLVYGAPVATPDEDHATRAMQATAGLDWFLYEGPTCRAGIGVEALLAAAYDQDFSSKAASFGGRGRVPIQCGAVVIAPSVGLATVTTPRERGGVAAYGLTIGFQVP
jgi:hypothetical protein